jgi:hypothetical protein
MKMTGDNFSEDANKDFPRIRNTYFQRQTASHSEELVSDNIQPSIEEKELWSSNYLVSRLKEHLERVEFTPFSVKTDKLDDGRNFDSRKYCNQAYHYLKIGALKPVPAFFISLSDLSPRLVIELSELDKEDRNYILKQAVGRIFEDINCRLYHDSISVVLRVELLE